MHIYVLRAFCTIFINCKIYPSLQLSLQPTPNELPFNQPILNSMKTVAAAVLLISESILAIKSKIWTQKELCEIAYFTEIVVNLTFHA